jgi:hypothetical protein
MLSSALGLPALLSSDYVKICAESLVNCSEDIVNHITVHFMALIRNCLPQPQHFIITLCQFKLHISILVVRTW